MATHEKHAEAHKVGLLVPELRLSTLIQVNTDLNFATVIVRGSLTESNCAALMRIAVCISYLAPSLKITMDLSGAPLVDRKALRRLEVCPSWSVIAPVSKSVTDGELVPRSDHLGVESAWDTSFLTSPGSIATHDLATNVLSEDAGGEEYVRPAVPSRMSPQEPFPEDLSILDQLRLEVLNSRTLRQLDLEYIRDVEPHPETSARVEALAEELDRRDNEYSER